MGNSLVMNFETSLIPRDVVIIADVRRDTSLSLTHYN